ncbi:MAG: aroA [Solirubrobacterales bacterium]|nr:aroA [Solirubrobacterales bacterium]
MSSTVRFDPVRRLKGSLTPPADKSISHRSALLGAMASEPVRVRNYLDAADTNSTLAAMAQLGALVDRHADHLVIRGTGLREAAPALGTIDVGNAGTLMRLLPGWLAAQEGRSYTLDGDASIRGRPVDRIAIPLRLMGARLEARDERFPPFAVHGTRLHGIDYTLPVASAQVKSCVLLAALMADGETIVREPEPSRDHTERMLLAAGIQVQRTDGAVRVVNQDELVLDEEIIVPADLSSAAFAIAAGILVPKSRLVLRGVNTNWTRTGFLKIAQRMGAIIVGDLEEHGAPLTAGEPTGDLDVTAGPLHGTTVESWEVPLAIDELPLVALLGCFAEGETIVRGAAELKVKESDRIQTVVDGLNGLGGQLEATDDGFVVTGTGGLRGGTIHSHGDHRLAMLGAVAGLASREGVEVVGMDAADVSYPGFAADMAGLLPS